MTAYRTAPLTPPVAPPWWQRLAAKVAPDLLGASEWKWYRRSVGGRWCRVRLYSEHTGNLRRNEGEVWARVHCCPRPMCIGWHRYSGRWLVGGPPSVPIGWSVEAAHTVDDEGRCTCEVWP